MSSVAIELLAPARDLSVGRAAIDAGADAVYIGPERFGARSAAGNSMSDIKELCRYAHIFGCKVWATLNTLLYDNELDKAVGMAWELYEAGVDGLLIQDMGLLECELPPVRLHASTQCDCRDKDKLEWLERVGFQRAVLARELSCEQISEINRSLPNRKIEMEAFVHGALCVSYSGQCYMSEAVSRRSANRGCCAQLCRQRYDILDADRQVIRKDCYPLSLCDLDRSSVLSRLLEAGVTSLKIEGRLKDADYVRNVTGFYRQLLDRIIEDSGGRYRRASVGIVRLGFDPDPQKTFHRSGTAFQFPDTDDSSDSHKPLHIANIFTPKSTGEPIGTLVGAVRPDIIDIATETALHSGDGITIGTEGAFVNRVEKLSDGIVRVTLSSKVNTSPPAPPPRGGESRESGAGSQEPGIRSQDKGVRRLEVSRNFDKHFHDLLSSAKTRRSLPIEVALSESGDGFLLRMSTISDEPSERVAAELSFAYGKTQATNREAALSNIRQALGKLGGTPFEAVRTDIMLSEAWFIPVSKLNAWRRETAQLLAERLASRRTHCQHHISHPALPASQPTDYRLNVCNGKAREFYRQCGVSGVSDGYELDHTAGAALMTCRYCLLREFGQCRRLGTGSSKREPSFLRTGGKTFRLVFDCRNCRMQIFPA